MSAYTNKKTQKSSTYEYNNNKPTFSHYKHITPHGIWSYIDGERIFTPFKPLNNEDVR